VYQGRKGTAILAQGRVLKALGLATAQAPRDVGAQVVAFRGNHGVDDRNAPCEIVFGVAEAFQTGAVHIDESPVEIELEDRLGQAIEQVPKLRLVAARGRAGLRQRFLGACHAVILPHIGRV
jgi:hypothetical protein